MPDFCSSGRCANTNETPNVSLHLFPKTSGHRDEWTKFVQDSKNDDEWLPSSTSRLCSDHFTPENFKNWVKFRSGYANKLLIKPDALPGALRDTPLTPHPMQNDVTTSFNEQPVISLPAVMNENVSNVVNKIMI